VIVKEHGGNVKINANSAAQDLVEIIVVLRKQGLVHEVDALTNIAAWLKDAPSEESVDGHKRALHLATDRIVKMEEVLARGRELLNTLPTARWWIVEASKFIPDDEGTPT
jgi:hypothetical protein